MFKKIKIFLIICFITVPLNYKVIQKISTLRLMKSGKKLFAMT